MPYKIVNSIYVNWRNYVDMSIYYLLIHFYISFKLEQVFINVKLTNSYFFIHINMCQVAL